MSPIDCKLVSSEVKTILFVEDEDFLRTVIADVLTAAGYHVLTASNGVEAMEVRALYQGALHLLLTDFCMPLKNGERLAEELTAAEPSLKTIFISGYGDLSEGATFSEKCSFLPKPFSIKTLTCKIRETLDLVDSENPEVTAFPESARGLSAVAS